MPSFPVSRSNSQPLLPLWENSTQQANLHLLLLKVSHLQFQQPLQAELPNIETNSKNFLLKSNPVTNGILLFRVNYELGGNATVTIYNNLGNKVFRKSITAKQYMTTSLDISKLAGGYYTMEYECNGKNIKERFIKY